jgi:glycosyltransferase involved in cell wall biosynthesis
MQNNPTLSVCMIVKNEAKNLPRLLDSIKGLADEVIIVDTGSTDNTVEIAQRYDAKTYCFEWCDDFSAARNESLKYATKDCILWLDADDEISNEEHIKIMNDLRRYKNAGFFLKLKNIQEDNINESLQLRIFPNRRGIIFEGRVHEQALRSVQRNGIPTYSSDAVILHYGYKDAECVVEKFKRNREILEKELKETPDNMNAIFFLSRTLRGLGENELVLTYINRTIELYKKKPNPYNYDIVKIAFTDKAILLYAMGQEEEARKVLEEGEKLFPEYASLIFTLGELYYRRKDYGSAFNELLPLKDETFESEIVPLNIQETRKCLRSYLGISALFAGRYDIAEECFRTSIDHDPQDASNYHYCSLAREKSGDLGKAIEACNEGLQMVSNDGCLMKRRFLLYAKQGKDEKAFSEFERLNGNGADIDVLSAMFLLQCRALNIVGINHYYNLIQGSLSVPAQYFPEGIDKTKETLIVTGESQALELFESAIAHLLKINA